MSVHYSIVWNCHNCEYSTDDQASINDLCSKFFFGWNVEYAIKEKMPSYY